MFKNVAKDFEKMWDIANSKASKDIADIRTEARTVAISHIRNEYLKMMLSMYLGWEYESASTQRGLIDCGPGK